MCVSIVGVFITNSWGGNGVSKLSLILSLADLKDARHPLSLPPMFQLTLKSLKRTHLFILCCSPASIFPDATENRKMDVWKNGKFCEPINQTPQSGISPSLSIICRKNILVT